MRRFLLLSTLAVTGMLSSMSTAADLWEGAEWIGTDHVVLNAQYTGEFSLSYDVALASPTDVSQVLFGGNDERLLNRNLNHFGLEGKKDEVYMTLTLTDGKVRVARRGFDADEDEKTIASYKLPAGWEEQPMHVKAEVEMGKLKLTINKKTYRDIKLTPAQKVGCDYITYPVLGEIGYCGTVCIEHLEIRNLRSPYTLYYNKEKLEADTPLFDPSSMGMPLLRTVLNVADKKIERATVYATARGIYDLYLNDAKVGDEYFAPGLSQYNKTHYYQSYDIGAQLHGGSNTLYALLGEGWWMGTIGFWERGVNHYGDQLALLAKIVVRYADGEEQTFATNPCDWQVTTDGAIRYSSRFHGEIVDGARLITRHRDQMQWQPAQVMTLEGHLPSESSMNIPAVDDYSHYQLLPQPDQGVKQRATLVAQSVEEVRPGVYVYDMGQNMAGLPLITFHGLRAGQQVRMRFAEVKYPDMEEYALNKGMVMMENIRAAFAQDLYFANGSGEETFAPHFTLHGYRFVEITGIDAPIPIEDVKGRVLSSIELASGFECSDELVNRLWKNIQWSSLGNFISIPTDCPQRNERMGWSGDINVFSRTSTYIAQNYEFLRRHTRNIRDVQSAEGCFPDVAPVGGGFGGFLWGGAGITVPYEAWRQTGRREILLENYDAMVRYMDYVKDHFIDAQTGLFVQTRSWGDLGDWLNLEYYKLDASGLFECYYIFDLQCMAEMARELGRLDDAAAFAQHANERKAFFVATYVDAATGKILYSDFKPKLKGQTCDYEASYVLPLAFGIIDDAALRQKMTDNLVAAIERENTTDQGVQCPPYSLMTGFVTTAWINKALTDNGRADVAYRLLLSRSYPSWLYPVTQGATTIWERLNSYNDFEGFGGNNSMNSFNHYSFGAVGQWMMNRILGIERDDTQAGFRHFVLRPIPDPTGQMTWANGWLDTDQGTIRAGWERKANGRCIYRFTIPAGCTANLVIDGRKPKRYKAGQYEVKL